MSASVKETLEILDELRRVGSLYNRYENRIKSDEKWLENKDWLAHYKEVVINEVEYYKEQMGELYVEGLRLLNELNFYKEWFRYLEGKSEKLLLQMLGYIDWRKVKHPSSLHAYAGLVTPESKYYTQHRREFKTLLYLQGYSFLKFPPQMVKYMVNKDPLRDGGYARLYKKFRSESDAKHPDWNATRRFRDALRKTMRCFLTHMYVVLHFLDMDGIVDYHYKAKEDRYIYMPPYDKLKKKPKWLEDLEEEYLKLGIKPIYI